MSKQINIGGRLHSTEQGNVITGANEVLDDTKGKKQNVINADVDAELLRLDQSKQNNLTFDNTPTENSNNPVKSSGVYAADKALSDAIEAIILLIPSAATALNQLADKSFVNSSIATDTATFRGTSETGLSEAQFLEWANSLTHDMNDYVFWQTIDEAGNTLFKRYKWNGTQWLYEYTLNNSSFTADQWAAITSGITTALVEKLVGLPTNTALQQALNSKQDALTFDNVPTENSNNPVKSGGVYSAVKAEEDARLNLSQTVSEIGGDVSQIEEVIPAGATAQNKLVANSSMEAYVASIIQNITASFTLATTDGHINLTLTQVNGQVATITLSSSDIASAQALTALTGRVTTAEGNITSLTGRVSTNETDIANLQQLYNDLQQSKPVPVTALPSTGQQQGVIYRLAGTTSYSDYMWNGSSWVLMATYNNAIDDEPTYNSHNLIESNGAYRIGSKGMAIDSQLMKTTLALVDFPYNVYLEGATGKQVNHSSFYTTEYIKVKTGDSFDVTVEMYGTMLALAAYDKDLNFLQDKSISYQNLHHDEFTYTVDSSVAYIRISTRNSSYASVELTTGTMFTELHETVKAEFENEDILVKNPIYGQLGKIGYFDFTINSKRVYYDSSNRPLYNESRKKTTPIPVNVGDVIKVNNINAGTNVYSLCALNANFEFISASSILYNDATLKTLEYTVPSGVVFIILVSTTSSEPQIIQIGQNNDIEHKIQEQVAINDLISVGIVDSKNSQNLTISDFYYNVMLNGTTGKAESNANFHTTKYIKVYANDTIRYTTYMYGTPLSVAAYDSKLKFLSNKSALQQTGTFDYEVDSSVAYIRVSTRNTEYAAVEFSNSSVESVAIILPDKIYAVEGDTLQLFHKSIVKANNPYVYDVQVLCAYGKLYKRYFTFTPTASQLNTNVPLTYRVVDDNGKVIASKTSTLYVLPKMTSPASNKNVMLLGDSLFAYGEVITELNRRVKLSTGDGTPANPTGLGLNNITFVGRKEVNNLHLEAYGGYSWAVYGTNSYKAIRFYVNNVDRLNLGDTYSIQNVAASTTYYMNIEEINVTEGAGNILCRVNGGYIYSPEQIPSTGSLLRLTGSGDATVSYSSYEFEAGNPFWNEEDEELDIEMYADEYLDGASIDIIITNLSANGIYNYDEMLDYAKAFIRKYHEQYPNGKIVLGTVQISNPNGPLEMSERMNAHNGMQYRYEYYKGMQAIVNDAEFSSYVSLMNLAGEFDPEYSYPYRAENVNNRITAIQENIGTNLSHPSADGYKQLADSCYRALTSLGL